MQSVAYTHNKPRVAAPVKSQNQFKPQRRDGIHHRVILAAVREWESTLPGQAQERIAQLVAEEWAKVDSRGITVNKQNLFRYLKNEGGSEKYTAYIMQLSGSIIAAMPVQIARKHGLSNARLIGAPLQKLEKEIREAAIALFNMLPADAAGPLLASISAVAPQLF